MKIYSEPVCNWQNIQSQSLNFYLLSVSLFVTSLLDSAASSYLESRLILLFLAKKKCTERHLQLLTFTLWVRLLSPFLNRLFDSEVAIYFESIVLTKFPTQKCLRSCEKVWKIWKISRITNLKLNVWIRFTINLNNLAGMTRVLFDTLVFDFLGLIYWTPH